MTHNEIRYCGQCKTSTWHFKSGMKWVCEDRGFHVNVQAQSVTLLVRELNMTQDEAMRQIGDYQC